MIQYFSLSARINIHCILRYGKVMLVHIIIRQNFEDKTKAFHSDRTVIVSQNFTVFIITEISERSRHLH